MENNLVISPNYLIASPKDVNIAHQNGELIFQPSIIQVNFVDDMKRTDNMKTQEVHLFDLSKFQDHGTSVYPNQ